MSSRTNMRIRLRTVFKNIAFSRPVRAVARAVPGGMRQIGNTEPGIRKQDLAYRKLISDSLLPGHFYARIRFQNYKELIGRDFELYEGENVVYGNRIEAPPRGHALEYSNIIVTSDNASDFSLNLECQFSIQFSKGQFETKEQIEYDRKFGINRHKSGLYYSLRGNTADPSYLIVTFPGFGPSTTRIPYAVSALQSLDIDLEDVCIVAFQDRYGVSGTYMMFDNCGRPLLEKVVHEVKMLMGNMRVDESKVLFFGASKGGTTALHVASYFPKGRLVAAVPQINLSYYTKRPFFKNNLGLLPYDAKTLDTRERLRILLDSGGKIDYFYSWNDELSNDSTVEKLVGYKNLTRYRVRGKHGEVTTTILPTIYSIMLDFTQQANVQLNCIKSASERFYYCGPKVKVQTSLLCVPEISAKMNYFLALRSEEMSWTYYSLSDHAIDFVKFMDTEEFVDIRTQRSIVDAELVGFGSDGTTLHAKMDVTRFSESLDNIDTEFWDNWDWEVLPPAEIVPNSVHTTKIIMGDEIAVVSYKVLSKSVEKVRIFEDESGFAAWCDDSIFERLGSVGGMYVEGDAGRPVLALLQHLRMVGDVDTIEVEVEDGIYLYSIEEVCTSLPEDQVWYREGLVFNKSNRSYLGI